MILSGGPGDGLISEPQSMRTMAIALGVPPSAILLDERGLNTQDTVRNTIEILGRAGPNRSPRLLAVSHSYHLPRIKLTCQRAGIEAYTVPAQRPFSSPTAVIC